jgi:hypothetical protein
MKKEEIEKLVELQQKKENITRIFDKLGRSKRVDARLFDSNGYEQVRFSSDDIPLLSEEMMELFYSMIGDYLGNLKADLNDLVLTKQGALQPSLIPFNILQEGKKQKDEECEHE